MPQTLLNKCCVRTSLLVKDEYVNQGTGVIVGHNGKHYVLTAEHCINGDNDEYKDIVLEDIIVEYQHNYNSEFIPIKVLRIEELNKTYDWALLEIEKPEIDCDYLKILSGDNFLIQEDVHFRGYQFVNNTQPRTWNAAILDLANDEFMITLVGKSFEQGGEMGKQMAKGLSGSGVFIIRANTLYLVGHLKRVIGNKALNDDIKCCKIKNLQTVLNSDIVDLSDLKQIDLWEKAMEKKITDDDVKTWIDQHDEHFNNLIRKSKIFSSNDEKAEENARNRILKYLDREYRNYSISGVSDLITQFEATSESFEESVKEAFTRTVENTAEAKDLLLKLEKEFSDHIKDLVNDKTNKNTRELARHKVTWWLMNCSFDFRE